ncbi:MAG: hypothetical protein LBS31_01300 [Candidatus Adiutrix sp.]|jgi:outer membrane protein insertion porin family|nr:hypothetical protein [Candidatus Adiutrix sp.]
MKKIVCLLALAFVCVLHSAPLSAQDGQKVAVAPFTLSADGAQLAQLSQMSKGLMDVVVRSFSSQGFTPIPMGDNVLANGVEAAKAQARDLGADYIFLAGVTKSGERFNMTGQLVSLGRDRSSERLSAAADKSINLPLTAERLVLMTSDHLFGGGARVAAVTVSGNTMVDSQAILNALRIRPGGSYNEAKATSDIKRIYSMGYFDDVRVSVSDVRGGKAVHFTVKERSQLGNIVFKGNEKFDHDDLMKVVGIKEYDVPSELALAESVENIKKLYTDKGYPQVQVVASIESGDDGRGLLVYEIVEGGRIYIKEIDFDGNEFYSDWTLSRKIDTSERNFLISWISGSGKLDYAKLSSDVQKLEAFYHNSGFLQARVGEPSIDAAPGGGLIVT